MASELSKTYEPADVEAEAYRVWLEEKCFHADPAASGEPYCIVIPPPNVTGALHLGHAINNTLQDILIRKHRMAGFNAVWIPGIDHAGIATQAVVEKQLKEKENLTRHDVGREGLIQRIWAWKEQYAQRILDQLARIGASCDWDRTRFTLDEMCARAVRETFFKLFKDGLIYRGKRLVNWDVFLQTSVSDDEIYHETVKTSLWHIRYPIEGTSEYMIVATTRPETMLGDTAVAVHSEDVRWNQFIGEKVRLPLTDRLIPIIADDILVDPKFGSGVVKVTPAHDPNDYAVWQRHKGKDDEIDLINILNPDGTINAAGGAYAGMKREAARKKVVADLEHLGLLAKEEPYETQVGHSDRSKTPIEPYLSDQWFIKMAPLAEPALEVVREGEIKFFPERHAQQYLAWLGEKRDWPISRQLWWGHRIPVWTFQWGMESDATWSQKSANSQETDRKRWLNELRGFFAKANVADEIHVVRQPNSIEYHLCAVSDRAVELVHALEVWVLTFHVPASLNTSGAPAKPSAMPTHRLEQISPGLGDLAMDLNLGGNLSFVRFFRDQSTDAQDPDVLDTWFSSALWPHSTLGWPEKTADLAKWYPGSVLLTGRDIITLWVARMVMMGMYNMGGHALSPSPGTPGEGRDGGSSFGENAAFNTQKEDPHPGPPPEYQGRGLETARAKNLGIPFHHVAINPTILDGRGEIMSKSKGNGVDPVDIIDSHGADAMRFTLTQMATETQDARLPVQLICPHCQHRFNNPEGKEVAGICPKCGKPLTRPMGTAVGTADAPLARATSDKFDIGRNFCNKLWNAARFALSNLETIAREPVDASRWTLADRWIVSRFNRTIGEADAAIASYRFDQYAKVCYDFFWRDFCDWYVEAAKPALRDARQAGQSANVLAAMLDGALRLMHPMIPFITETIWWRLNDVAPDRGLADAAQPPAKRLIRAAWPIAGKTSDADEALFAKLQEIIAAVRNVRNEYKVEQKKSVAASISAGDLTADVQANRALIELLATCELKEIAPTVPAPANAAKAIAAGCEIFLANLVDPQAEKQRHARRIEELTRQIGAMKAKLSNDGYVSKAPPKVVEETKAKLADAEAELRRLGD